MGREMNGEEYGPNGQTELWNCRIFRTIIVKKYGERDGLWKISILTDKAIAFQGIQKVTRPLY